MRDRGWRRAQRYRVIEKTRNWMRSRGLLDPRHMGHDFDGEKSIRKNANTPHQCSSYCCGNPRRWFKEETRQEKKSRLKGRDLY